jgi:ATP-dependent exoDNAse (exonuclease V) beta subunit
MIPSQALHDDDEARRLIATAIDLTLIVEAAAGTGKTTELVNRIVLVLEQGRAEVSEVVAVTFTEKAAGELKLRLREQLEAHRSREADPEVLVRLQRAVQGLEEAHVNTIHGFCADLLRERPVEARVDPLFRVLTDTQSQRLFDEAFDTWLQKHLDAPPEGLRRSLRRAGRTPRPGEADEDGPVERLRRAGFELTQWRDFRAPWTREAFDRESSIRPIVDLIHALADASAGPSYAGDNLFLDTAPVRRFSDQLRKGIVEPHDLDGLESRIIDLRRNRDFWRARKGTGPTYGKGMTRAQVLAARDALVMALDDFQVRADADLAALLHGELGECVEEYEALKRRSGALDFLDLLLRARNLVRDDAGVRRHFQQRFKRIFVDEFQDTDPLQAELIVLLAADDPEETRWARVKPLAGKLFVVGDPKQSIYRFRRADVDVYRRVCEQLERSGGRRIELRKSFRGVPSIQRFVNAAFSHVMDGDAETLQARYVPLEPARRDHPGQPAIVALPVPRPYGRRFISAREIESSLPDAVGAYVHWLVRHSGWTVTERRQPGARVPLQPRHVCLLFRRFVSFGEDMTSRYVEALEARGVSHLLVGGRAFHDREEIETLRAALMAIEWPDDQLSVFATLRGALFAIGDEELLEYHHLGGRFHPFRIPPELPARLAPVREALEQLGTLHRRRNRRPVADTISELLDTTRAHVGFVLRPAGEQALANVLHVAELARQYEADGGMSFRGFVDALQREASSGAAAEAPILEEGSDGVRLMTVHKAKGLEFPVVILADITARLTPFDAGRFVDSERGLCALRIGGWSPADLNAHRALELRREEREGERLAYVAATRARDLLVVPALGDGPYSESWIAPLSPAIYPADSARRQQSPAAGCPSFKSRDTVLNRPDGDPARITTVCPGEHRFGAGPEEDYSVVWWSPEPEVLALGAQPVFGLRRDDLIVREVAPSVVREYLDAYTRWRLSRDAAIRSASTPSIDVTTATEAAAGGLTAPPDGVVVAVEEVQTDDGRPHGVRFGTLVHALLSAVPLDGACGAIGDPPDVTGALSRLASAHGRMLGASEDEMAAARAIVARLLSHPWLRRAARAGAEGRCYREAPVTYRRDDGGLIEGTVDLAFDEGDGFVVIDFKTDRPDRDSRERYLRQVGWYAAAVARATGRPAKGVLMLV